MENISKVGPFGAINIKRYPMPPLALILRLHREIYPLQLNLVTFRVFMVGVKHELFPCHISI